MKILFFANTDWYLYNFRLDLAKALQARGDVVILVSPEGKYAPQLQAMGFRWVRFQMQRGGQNPLNELGTIFRLIKLYQHERPDLIHQFTVKCVLYGSLASSLINLPKVVNSVTGLGYVFIDSGSKRQWMRNIVLLFYRLVLRKTWVVFQNVDDMEAFENLGLVESQRVALIRGSGVDIARFTPRSEPDGQPVVILPARLLWDKGVGDFVKAAKILQKEGLKARFALVGDTDAENPAGVPVDLLHQWEKEGVIEWWGWQERMEDIYAQAHIICLPSYREGLPKTLIEAAACGRAIVTCDVPGCREVVHNSENGFLVPSGDAVALAEKIKQLVQQPALRRQMGSRGRLMAEKDFAMEGIIAQSLKLYQTVVEMEK